jgi:Flp pilus assembly protein TadD
MGRTRNKKKAASKATEPPIQYATSTTSSSPSIASLVEKTQSLIEQCDYDLAQRFIRRILEQQPTNAEAKEMLGVVLLEIGEIKGAKEVRRVMMTV